MSEWFPIDTLDVPDEPVLFRTNEGPARGWLKLRRSGPVYRISIDRASTLDLPRHAKPSGWRPLHPDRWPGILPDPIPEFPAPRQRPIDALEAPAEPDRAPWWIAPGFRLGRPGEAPRTIEEAEARIMRGLATIRTLKAIERREAAAPPNWPPALLVEARCVEKMLRQARTGMLAFLRAEDYDDFHIDRSAIGSAAVRFEPTDRDVEDATGAVQWLDQRNANIVRWRSFVPPYSYREIAERIGRTAPTARGWYYDAIERAWRRAR